MNNQWIWVHYLLAIDATLVPVLLQQNFYIQKKKTKKKTTSPLQILDVMQSHCAERISANTRQHQLPIPDFVVDTRFATII